MKIVIGSTVVTGTLEASAIGPSDSQQHTLPAVASDTFALLAASQNLTNKMLTAPTLSGTATGTYTLGGTPTLGSDLSVAANKSITYLTGSGGFDGSLGTGGFKTPTGASLFGGSSNTFSSGALGPASGQQHILPAVASDTFTLLAASQNLTNKTLTAPTLSGTVAGTYTLGGTSTLGSPGNSTTIAGVITVTGTATFNKFINPNYGGTSTDTNVPTWTAVSGGVGFQNSYVDFGAPYPTTAYRKDASGMVHVRLAAKSGTNTSTIFTLPVGFRPSAQLAFWADVDSLLLPNGIAITSAGAISAFIGGSSNVIANCSFIAEA